MAGFFHTTTAKHALEALVKMVQPPTLTTQKIQLHVGLDGGGSGEIASGTGYTTGGYAMSGSPPWDVADVGATQNADSIPSMTASGGTIDADEYALWADDGEGQRFIFGATLAPSLSIADGNSHVFAPGTLSVTLAGNIRHSWWNRFLNRYLGGDGWDPAVADAGFNNERHIGLATALPTFGPFASNELTGNGYSRVSIGANWSDYSAGFVSNNASGQPTFTAAGGDWSTADYFLVWDNASTSGEDDLIAWGALSAGIRLLDGQSHQFLAGTLKTSLVAV